MQSPDHGGERRGSKISSEKETRIERVVSGFRKKEIHRRIWEMETGRVKGIALEESLARARKAAGL